jgi:hypothetical protein
MFEAVGGRSPIDIVWRLMARFVSTGQGKDRRRNTTRMVDYSRIDCALKLSVREFC